MINFDLAQAAVYQPATRPGIYEPISDFVAVTSLSPHPRDLKRQLRALKSWQRFGLTIVSVNTSYEVSRLRGLYPMVSQWIESPGDPQANSRQRVWDLARVANILNQPILLINSDIVIEGEQEDLTSQIFGDHAIVGIRNNVRQGRVRRERWGFDVFYLTPQITANLPKLDWFLIGKPGWDYWLPLHFLKRQIRATYLADRLFYHHCHPTRWTQAENRRSLELLADRYSFPHIGRLRHRLPFPPGSAA